MLLGVLLIILGFLTIIFPLESFVTLSMVFSIGLFVIGIFQAIMAFSHKDSISSWVWEFIGGIVTMFIGAYLMNNEAAIGMEGWPCIQAFIC